MILISKKVHVQENLSPERNLSHGTCPVFYYVCQISWDSPLLSNDQPLSK